MATSVGRAAPAITVADTRRSPTAGGRNHSGIAGTGAVVALVAGCYALGALVAFRWFDVERLGPGFFPGAGVSLVALSLTHRRTWPWLLAAVAATGFTMNLANGVTVPEAGGYVLANTLEPVVGAVLLRLTLRHPIDLTRRRDLWLFLVCAVAAGPAVGAAVGAATHFLAGAVTPWPSFAERQWAGDALGVLLVGGAALGWRAGPAATRVRLFRPSGALLVLAGLGTSLAVFQWDLVWLGYLLVGLLVVVAFRLGTRGVGIVGLVMATVVGEAAASGRIAVPAGVSADAEWLSLNLVVGLVVVVALALAVEIGEREESIRRRREAEEGLREAEARERAANERARLLRAEQAARARAELLQEVTARLSGLTVRAQIVEQVVTTTARALASRSAVLAQPDDRGTLRAVAVYGYDDGTRPDLEAVLATPGAVLPLTVAFRTGRFVAESGRDAVPATFPDLARLSASFEAVAAVPCLVDGRVTGVLGWCFETERTFDDDFVALVTAIATQAGLALERARMFEAERRNARRHAALQSAVGRMSAAPRTQDVVAAVLGPATSAVGARGCTIGSVGGSGELRVLGAAGRVPALGAARAVLAAAVTSGEVVELGSAEAVRERFPGITDGILADGGRSWAVVPFDTPLAGTRGRGGGLLLGFAQPQDFDAEQVSLLVTLAQATGQSLARAAAAEREHGVAAELQRSLLGVPDDVDGIEVGTVYRPGTLGLQVGGDWYDVIRLPDGGAAMVIGDVAGHSLAAAAAMGQIRSTIRALSLLVVEPAALLTRLDAAVGGIDGATLTSLFYGVLDVTSGQLRYTCAGHPPPLAVRVDGTTEFLDAGHGPLLGIDDGSPRRTARTVLAPKDLLVLYTDGLVERRGESLTVGLERLRAQAAEASLQAATCREVCDHLTRTVLPGTTTDDTALLVVRRPR